MPTVGDADEYIRQAAAEIAALPDVEGVYVWGSFAENISNPKFNIKDVDLLVRCNFNSGDLLAIDKTPFGAFEIPSNELEDEGFNPRAVSFTKKYLKFSQFNIDQWAISQDERLLHWGPITETVSEWADLRKEAEAHAKEATGLTRKRLCRASNDDRSKWRNAYNEYVQDFITGGPVGWYASETILDDIIDQAIRLS